MKINDNILEVINRIYAAKRVLIYGAKEKGKDMLSVCLNIGWDGEIEIAVTNLEKELKIDTLTGYIEVKDIKSATIDKDTLIIVCMGENYYSEVNNILSNIGIDKQMVLYPSGETIMELKKYAISYRLKSMNIDLNLLKTFSPDDVNSLFWTWEVEDRWECRSIQKKMWEIANEETAEYVIQNMLMVEYYKNRDQYLEMLAQSCMKGNGLKLEFGVASGASIWKLAKGTKDKFYGFDSFEGLQEKFKVGMEIGYFKQKRLPSVPENVELVKGYYADTLSDFLVREDVRDKMIEFMHIDCDLYSSTKQVFQYMGKKIDKGTIIAFDEYFNYPGWKNGGEFKAFQEWVSENHVTYEYIAYVDNSAQVAIRILSKEVGLCGN